MNKIALIYPLETELPLQSTSYRVHMPRYGLLVVADRLIEEGYEVRTFCEQSGSSIDWDYVESCDIFCFSILSFSAFKAYSIAKKLRKKYPHKPIIFGGSHASLAPDDCLDHADYVIRNEGEETLVEILKVIKDKKENKEILGCSLWDNGQKKHNKARPFVQNVDRVVRADLIEDYRKRTLWDYTKDILNYGIPRFNVVVSQSSRGCPFDCKFCFVKIELGKKYRKKTPELVLEEVSAGIEQLNSKFVMFVDNDFCIDRGHSIAVLDLLAEKYGGDLDIFIFTRIGVAKDKQMIEAFKRAGNVCLAVGIESISYNTQVEFKKKQSISHIEECLKILSEEKIKYHALFVVGSDFDTKDTIEDILRFSLENNAFYMGMQILYDFPFKEKLLGAEQSIADDRFIHQDWRFFSGSFAIHFPEKIRPSQLQRAVLDAHMRFYKSSKFFIQFYATKGVMRSYIKYLEKAEEGLYDENDCLLIDKLKDRILEKKISIKYSIVDYILEVIRFYYMNVFRKDSWAYLKSLIEISQRKVGEK